MNKRTMIVLMRYANKQKKRKDHDYINRFVYESRKDRSISKIIRKKESKQ